MLIPSCSIIIPIYKEPNIKNTILELINTFHKKNLEFEIIAIVDSTQNDDTDEVIKNLTLQHKEIKSIIRKEKKGVADAIKVGIKNTVKETTLIVMGDGSERPDNLINLISEMSRGYDMVFANRFDKQSTRKSYPIKKLVANRVCNFLIRLFFNFKSQDITNGVKVYKTKLLKELVLDSTGFEIFVEIPLKLFIKGHKNFTEVTFSHDAGDVKYSNFSLIKEAPRYLKIVLKCYFKK